MFKPALVELLLGIVAGRASFASALNPTPICSVLDATVFLRGDLTTCLIPGAEDGQRPINTSTPVWRKADSWTRGICHDDRKGAEFCAYTNPSFGTGEGISIITTNRRIQALSTLPVFESSDTHRPDVSPTHDQTQVVPLWQEVEIPGKDIGVVATQPIRAGKRLMARTPAVMVDGEALDALSPGAIAKLLANAAEQLPPLHRAQFLNLSSHNHHEDEDEGEEKRIYKIFATNAFRTGLGDNQPDFHSVFRDVSRINHDCRPNSAYYFDPVTLSHKVFAVTDIMPGEELTVSYIDPFQPREARQSRLRKLWGFTCSCDRCAGEPHIVAESDSRVAQIHALWRELDDYNNARATPAKAELLVALFELEGMESRAHEAYYRAAIEWSGAGDAAMAALYARWCLDRGLVVRGNDQPFVKSMRELIEHPEEHWSWKFRVRLGEKREAGES